MNRHNNHKGPQAANSPQIDMSQIPLDHIPLVLNSIICERLLDFNREVVTDAQGTRFTWTGIGQDGCVITELFDFVRQDPMAIDMLTRFGDQNGLGFNLIRIPDIPQLSKAHWLVQLTRADASGQPMMLAGCSGNRLGAVICLILCGYIQADIFRQHRELYPAHYLQSSGGLVLP